VPKLNKEAKYIATILFRNRVYRSDGQSFEDFFCDVMQKDNKNFQKVKPQGAKGDRKNDGFDKTTGTYYQVYAPEDSSTKLKETIAKLNEDFKGLKKHWDSLCQIKKYFFVINDKYKGVYPDIHQELLTLGNNNPGIEFNLFLPKDLEVIFLNLKDDDMVSIVGIIPDASKVDTLNYSVVTEVINFILNRKEPVKYEEKLIAPEFENKIIFNGLNKNVEMLLKVGNYQVSAIDDYFRYNSKNAKQDLRDRFTELYKDSKERLNDSNKVFFDILTEVCPDHNSKQVQDAAIVIMSYYFEACDIFEPPQ
jgi:hypothetical protein